MRYLTSGVTSVVDMGGPLWTFEVRDLANKSIGRRELPAGHSSPPLLNSLRKRTRQIVATSPEMARELVRKNASASDPTKILFIRISDINLQFAVVKAAAETIIRWASALPSRHRTQTAVALRAGADILVHSVEDQRVDRILIGKERSLASLRHC
jgi:hypothetical protein